MYLTQSSPRRSAPRERPTSMGPSSRVPLIGMTIFQSQSGSSSRAVWEGHWRRFLHRAAPAATAAVFCGGVGAGFHHLGFELGAHGPHDLFAGRKPLVGERRPVFGCEDHVGMEGADDCTTPANVGVRLTAGWHRSTMIFVKVVTQVKLMPEAEQAAALSATLRTVNDLACWVSEVAFAHGVPREYELCKHTYPRLKAAGLGCRPPSTPSRRCATPTPP